MGSLHIAQLQTILPLSAAVFTSTGLERLACARLAYQLGCFILFLFRKQPSITCQVIPPIVTLCLSRVFVMLGMAFRRRMPAPGGLRMAGGGQAGTRQFHAIHCIELLTASLSMLAMEPFGLGIGLSHVFAFFGLPIVFVAFAMICLA